MKPAELWNVVRGELDPLLAARGFDKLKSSPPAWTRKQGKQACTIWFKTRSAGAIAGEGGSFTGALQLAPKPAPGIESAAGKFESRRLYRLFDDADMREAKRLFRGVVKRRTRNTTEKIVTYDVWCVYLDADDVRAWTAVLGRAITRELDARG